MNKKTLEIAFAVIACLISSWYTLTATAKEKIVVTDQNWYIESNTRGERLYLKLQQPFIISDRLTKIFVNGVALGIARPSVDLMSASTELPKAMKIAPDSKVTLGPPMTERLSVVGSELPFARHVPATALTVDPGLTGPFPVKTIDYHLGDGAITLPEEFGLPDERRHVEMTARIYAPTDTTGSLPVVIFLHGGHAVCHDGDDVSQFDWPCRLPYVSIPSYLGYEAPAKLLASHGYVVVSLSANGISVSGGWMYEIMSRARGFLIRTHLEYLRRANESGTPELGEQLRGRLDLDRIGLLGHSLGGEGVIAAAEQNKSSPHPFGIRAVLAIAPTNFTRITLPDIPLAVILPYCDGDVQNLEGQHYVDDSRHAFMDSAIRSSLLFHGANHNYFNTIWTPGFGPGASDDVNPNPPPWESKICLPDSGYRLDNLEQQAAAKAYIAGFFRLVLGGENHFLPLYDGSNIRIPSVGRADVRSVSIAPASNRLEINSFERHSPLISYEGIEAELCDSKESWSHIESDLPRCITGENLTRHPHWEPAEFNRTLASSPMMRTRWHDQIGRLVVKVPDGSADASGFINLSFRIMPIQNGLSPLDMEVVVIDGHGIRSPTQVSQFSDALTPLPGANTSTEKLLLQQINIPLISLEGLDKSDIRQIEFRLSQGVGDIYISDLNFSNSSVH